MFWIRENPTRGWPEEIVLPIDMMKLKLHLKFFIDTLDWIQNILEQPRFSTHIFYIVIIILSNQFVTHDKGYHMHRTIIFEFLVHFIDKIN